MYKTPMEHKTIFLSIFIVLCSLLVSYSPVMVGYQGVYYGMTPSKLLCMSRWHDKSAFSLGVNSVCLAFVLVPIVVILFAYFRIFLKVRAAKLRIKEFTLVASKSKSDQNTSDTFEPTESMNALERRVLLQSVSIVLCNCAGWTPSFLMIIISLVTGIEPARSFDSFGYISAALAIMMNGLVIIFFDKQIVSDIKKVIWKK